MLNELRYRKEDFDRLDEDDIIIVFKGHVYPIYVTDYSNENIKNVVSLIKTLTSTYTGLYEVFFEDDGHLKEYLSQPYKLMNAIGNFEGLPKLLFGTVCEYGGQYAIEFESSVYDIANSSELKQLLASGILDQFTYLILNNKAYVVDEIKSDGITDNKKETNSTVTPLLYHGTTSKFLVDIISKGIRQIKDNSIYKIENRGFVYLTSIFDSAFNYAKDYVHKFGGYECVIVVDTNSIDRNRIVTDFDVANAYSTDVENSPYAEKINAGKNVFFKGDVVKNSADNGTKYAKLGYKGIIMPNAIKGAYVKMNGELTFLTREEIIKNFNTNENKKHSVDEYISRYYRDKPNFSIKAYHTTKKENMINIFYTGYIDPQAEHTGECPYDVIWFSIEEHDYDGPFRFSFNLDEKIFDEMQFNWMNDIHLVTPHKIDVMDKRLRIEKIGGVRLDNLFRLMYDGSRESLDKFIDKLFEITDYELSNELFVKKILQQYGFKESDWFMNEDKKKVRQDIMLNLSLNEVDASDISLKSFEIRDELNPKFWINNKINSRVRLKLLDLADEFIESLAVDWVKPEDIVLTGSIANYNWSKYSDVDVHILMDFNKIWKKTEFVQDYFDSKKAIWSQEHENLKIYGFPVEMYVEDSNNDNPSSGIYSLNKNKWIVEPNDFQDAELNEKYIKKESAKIMTEIDDIDEALKTEKDNHKLEVLSTKLKKLFDRLHKQRKESLEKHGEMGTYNIIWKVLRRSGHLDKIWEIINDVYNKVNSIK